MKRRKHLTAMALLRARHADRNSAAMHRALVFVFQHAARELARQARHGQLHLSNEFKAHLARDLMAAIRRPMLAMAAHGFQLAGSETKALGKSRFDNIRGKAFENTGVGFSEDRAAFVLNNKWPNLEKWVKTTAESANQTFGERMLKTFENAAAYRDPETGRGRTPADIADELLSSGLGISEERADMLARTGSIWAYNEGAVERYAADGVEVVEWLTAEDDLACPFCAEMNGKRVETQESFFSNGDKLTVDDAVLSFKRFDVKHPPLHPNCRCTLIPVVDEGQL